MFDNIGPNFDVYLFSIGTDLQIKINEYNNKNQIDLFIFHSFYTQYPEIYKKDFNQLTDEEYSKLNKEYE